MDKEVKDETLEYLESIISVESSKLVGKIMKRFEIIDNKDVLKKEIKELVYENSRELLDIVEAYSKGIESTYFIFKNKEK